MKEIGKLIELFKEYVDKYSNDAKVLDEGEYVVIDDGQSFLYGTREYSYLTLISKKFGFVKWLVENDKIDYHNKINYHISLAIHWREKRTTREERLLMMLAIQDEPIRFLISILKDSNNTTKGEVKIGSENQDTKKLDITTTHIEGDTYLA